MIDSRGILKVTLALAAFAGGLGGAWGWRERCVVRPVPKAVSPGPARASLFDSRCASCHGREDGTVAGQAPMFRNPWQELSRARFTELLDKGIPGKMLPQPGLDDNEKSILYRSARSIQDRLRRVATLDDGSDSQGETLARVEGLDIPAPGRAAIVYCFSPDCLACWDKLPALEAWAAGRAGVDVVAVCQGPGAEALVARPGFSKLRRLADPAGRSRAAWDTATSPTILIVDEEGRVRARGHEWKMPGRPVSRVLFPGTSPG